MTIAAVRPVGQPVNTAAIIIYAAILVGIIITCVVLVRRSDARGRRTPNKMTRGRTASKARRVRTTRRPSTLEWANRYAPQHEVFRETDGFAVQPRTSQISAVRGAPGERNSRTVPQDVKIQVSIRDQGQCVRCGSTTDLHYDHKIPWSKNGTNTVSNIQLLCGRCNRRKGARDSAAW